MKKKSIALLMALVLVVGGVIGGTIAYLMDSTQTITNTFTVGDIEITLAETTGADYDILPGAKVDKNPTVTVLADSEKCYLFVKVEKSENLDTYVEYEMAAGWIELESGVYYRIVEATTEDTPFAVLKGNQVTIPKELDADDLELAETNKPTLAFTAYACQFANVADAAAAWAALNA